MIFIMLKNLMSSMPINAGLSLVMSMNLHLAVLSLCHNLTADTPTCSILDRLYVFSITEFYVVCNASIVDLGNNTLKFSNGNKVPLLLGSIFYVMHDLFDYYLTLIW